MFIFLLILNKFKTIFFIFCSSSNIHILCPTFGFCVKHEINPTNSLCFKGKYYTLLFHFFFPSNSRYDVRKNKDEGIAHNGPIILWWSLNDNGPRFCNAFMIKLGPHWNWNVKKPSPCNSHIISTTNYISNTYNSYVVNIQYKCWSMGEWYSYTLNCDYSLCTPTKQCSYHVCNRANIALFSSKNALPCCEMNSLAIPKCKTFILTPCYITYIH